MYDRRLPIYLLIDVSASMDGEPIQDVSNGIQQLIADLRADPCAIGMVWLSVIMFSDDASQIVPLTELESFQIPELTTGGKTNIGGALSLLCSCADREVRKHDDTINCSDDCCPLVFVFTDGKNDVGPFDMGVCDFKSHRWGKYAFFLAGANADYSYLRQINAEAIFKLDNIFSGTLRCLVDKSLHWDWYDDGPIRSRPLRKQLLVYIAIDCSETMSGLPIEAMQLGIRQLVNDIKQLNNFRLELLMGVVVFNDVAVELVSPISPEKITLPTLEANGRASIGKALMVLSDSAEKNSFEQTFPPLVFIVSADGRTTDGIEEGLSAFKDRSWGNVVICAAGDGVDIPTLKRIGGRSVFKLNDLNPSSILKFFDWVSKTIKFKFEEGIAINRANEESNFDHSGEWST